MFASSAGASKICVKLLTGRGAIIGKENILNLVFHSRIRCRKGIGNRKTTVAPVVRVGTRCLVFPSCLL
jgi:hypothetical protein